MALGIACQRVVKPLNIGGRDAPEHLFTKMLRSIVDEALIREAKKEQMLNSIKYGPLYSQNYYRIVKEKNRTYYEVYSLPRTETPPEDYTQVSFVCLRPDGAYEAPATVSSVCRYSRKGIGDMDDFHFHLLRHTYTTNLLSHGAAPKDVQELLGHSDVSTTMNIYAHDHSERPSELPQGCWIRL